MSKNEKTTSKLFNEVRRIVRLRHYSMLTEQAHVSWIERFSLFYNKKHPKDMGEPVKVENRGA